MSDNGQTFIKNIYENKNYNDYYGESLIITILMFIIVIYAVVRNFINVKSQSIKSKWDKNKCNPLYMPFAGKIMKPSDKTESEYTSQNISECMQEITKQVAGNAMQPVNMVTNMVAETFNGFFDVLNGFRGMFDYIRSAIGKIISTIMLKIMLIVLPLQRIIMSLNDMFQKVGGMVITGMFFLVGAYLTFVAGMDGLIVYVIALIIALLLPVPYLFALPFWVGFVPALIITVLVTFLSVLLAQATIFANTAESNGPKENMTNMKEYNDENNKGKMSKLDLMRKYVKDQIDLMRKYVKDQIAERTKKKKPLIENFEACFHEDTLLNVWGNQKVKIKDILIGDRLSDGSKVTGLFKLTGNNQEFYNLNGIIVTGNHKLLYNDAWIPVSEHPSSIELPNFHAEYIYCINTSSKKIVLNGILFSDWDELDEYDLLELRIKMMKNTKTPLTQYSVHQYLDGGFEANTMIELEDGRSVNISDVCVNDILRFGEKVIGVVKIDATELETIKEFTINENTFIGGHNLLYFEESHALKKTIRLIELKAKELSVEERPNLLYHLITDKSTFFINGIQFYDYNGNIEWMLDKDNKMLLQKILKN